MPVKRLAADRVEKLLGQILDAIAAWGFAEVKVSQRCKGLPHTFTGMHQCNQASTSRSHAGHAIVIPSRSGRPSGLGPGTTTVAFKGECTA